MMVPEASAVPLLGVGLLHADAVDDDVIAARRREDGLGIIKFNEYAFCDQFLEALYECTSAPCRLGLLLVRGLGFALDLRLQT
jgi:hypothetical protein